jgi:hypothetical protein
VDKEDNMKRRNNQDDRSDIQDSIHCAYIIETIMLTPWTASVILGVLDF